LAEKNLYEILGIDPKASPDQIKHAFRSLARKFHPDSADGAGNQFMFQKVTDAYDTLSNSELRKRYDEVHSLFSDREEKIKNYRKNASDAEKTSMSFDRLRSKLVDKDSEGLPADRFNEPRKRTPTGDIFGKVTESIKRFKSSDSTRPKDGSSSILRKVTGSFKVYRPESEGDERTGAIDFAISVIESIRGTTREVTVPGKTGPRLFRIRIPPGIADGGTLKVTTPATDTESVQDLQIRVRIVSSGLLDREGDDLVINIPIKVSEAICGGEVEVPTLEGPVKIKLPPGWDISKRLRLKGRGLPTDAPVEARGSLYVKTYLVLPDRISTKSTELAAALDELYLTDVRADLPTKL